MLFGKEHSGHIFLKSVQNPNLRLERDLVEPEQVEFWVSQSHRSYVQIIFPAGFAHQDGLNEDATMAKRSGNSLTFLPTIYVCAM